MLARELDVECDPIAAVRKLARFPGLSLLYSGRQAYGLGRYSILAANPEKTYSYRNGGAEIERGGVLARSERGLFESFEEELAETKRMRKGPLPYYGGPIGYFAYDAGRYLERVASDFGESEAWDARFGFYSGGIVFDHAEEKVYVTCSSEKPDTNLAEVVEALRTGAECTLPPFALETGLRSNFDRSEFTDAVARVREYIREGEVYQVNVSQRYEGDCRGSSLDLFCRLAKSSPAPYSAYLDFDDEQIISSSPERFLYLNDGVAMTRPIKGTRPAGSLPEEVSRHASELESSEKERSELLMIVDLERNDLGRVCEPGSIRVDELFRIERYATVIHQTADVTGRLEEGRSVMDCIKAMFPGGSITGAPKIRAMQIINELERGARGVYTGSIGYIDESGNADFNVAIRTVRVASGKLSYQVGSGIVWDSDPESEYEETLLKAKAMREAIEWSHG